MKNSYFKFVSGAALAVAFSLASCHSVYDVTKVEGRMQPIDSVYDVNPDAEAVALLSPYKAKIDSMMYRVVGTAEMSMDRGSRKPTFQSWWPMCCAERLRRCLENLPIWGL